MNFPTHLQQQIAVARGNVLVSAGAGTGKTSTLVQRCLGLLVEGGSLEHILMVTFTDAAAVEMRGRIREALRQKVQEFEARPNGHADQTEHLQKQLVLLDTALISTLHSFCLQLVREHFYELGIDPDVTVLDERQTQPLIQSTLDAVLERHYAGQNDQDQAVQALVRGPGRGFDDRIREWVLRLHRYLQARDHPEDWLARQRKMFSAADPGRWREWLGDAFGGWRESWLPALQPFTGNRVVGLALASLQNVSNPPTLRSIGEALRAVVVADRDAGNWPHGSKTKVRKPLEDFFDEAEFLASLAPSDGTDPLAEDWDLVRHDQVALLDLAGEFTADFSRAKREAGGVDFADLEQFALRLLRDPQTAAHWQQQLEYVFVDEYQDINAAQDAILRALSRSGGAANRFLVGDVKQSIYRFRLADPTIFRGYEAAWSGGQNEAQRFLLADNFRSQPGILDFVNALFRGLMREKVGGVVYEELKFGNPTERAALAGRGGQEPRVEVQLIARPEGRNENGEGEEEAGGESEVADLLATEREARLVALRLRELKSQQHPIWDREEGRFRPVQWNDMAVLLRSPASRVEAFAREFDRLGIPLQAARGGFFDSIEISDLVSLLKLLDNPLQDIPLLAVLRSPLVGMTLGELAEVRAQEPVGQRSKYFWLAARRFHQQKTKSNAAWLKLDLFLKQLDRWRGLVRQTSLSNCLETALNETYYESLLRANPGGEQQIANVRRLLELARLYDPYQRQGLFRFLCFVDAQRDLAVEFEPAGVSRDAVRLTSIHGSKGLEYPVVVLAGLGWQFNTRDLRENILFDEHYGLCPKILPPGGEQSYPSLPYWLARRRQQREIVGEELRLLYVAMTRARDTLVLTGTWNQKGAVKWRLEDEDEEEGRISDRELLSARSPLDWLKLWLPLVTDESDWKSDRAGQSKLLRWTIYSEDDPRLAWTETVPADKPVLSDVPEAGLAALRARMNWKYPFPAAARLKAKTSATELRRLSEKDEEAEPARYLRRKFFNPSTRRIGGLNAAEIGIAHHRFLQRMSLSGAEDAGTLRNEAERLGREGWLSGPERAVLDFAALAQFWQTDFGQKIIQNADAVRRELPFTVRFAPDELDIQTGRMAPGVTGEMTKDFIVVQGVVDLAVIRADEIWLLDFKTDEMGKDELKHKADLYRPQLRSYALALERIYQRPVTECRLHFLALRTTVGLDLA